MKTVTTFRYGLGKGSLLPLETEAVNFCNSPLGVSPFETDYGERVFTIHTVLHAERPQRTDTLPLVRT